MLINSLQLTNIGPYRGTNKFNFKVNKHNTVLIGGQNGSGKTTLLNSFKLGLFGSYAFGFKTENNDYFKKIDDMLNVNAKKFNENNFNIVLDIDLIDNFKKTNYKIYRVWKYKNENLKESFDVIGNGKHLDEYEKDVFLSKLKELMPPQLLDLSLFDGEEISKIINQNLLSTYIQRLSRVVFNLDLFETLEIDLLNYVQQNFDSKNLDNQENEIIEQRIKKNKLFEKITHLTDEIQNITIDKEQLEEEYQKIKKDFEIHGGLVKDQREKLNKKISKLEAERKMIQESIKSFVTNTLPFLISKDLISETRLQLSNEENYQLFNKLEKSLTTEKLSNIKNLLNLSDNQLLEQVRQEVLNLVKPNEKMYVIHGASLSENAQVENVFTQIQQPLKEIYLNLIQENKNKLNELSVLRNKLKINDASSEFNKMLNRMEEITGILRQVEVKLDNKKHSLIELKTAHDKIKNIIDHYDSKIKEKEKTKNAFEESQKIISLSRKFRNIQIQKKLHDVQIQATSMLKRMLRKHNYIYSIKIDSNTFDVILFDENREKIEKTTLSAGEKQILLLSIIWAIFNCSKRRVPFIFDTLLGRLDSIHKESILKELIPNMGKQVIILSTDTEIDKVHYNILKPNLAREYTLLFDTATKTTNISKNYFSLSSKELNV